MHESATPSALCGTYSGYQTHKRRGETPCGPCREANRAYVKDYRAARPAVVKSSRVQAGARNRALSQLAAAHPTEYQMLYEIELAKVAPKIDELRSTYKQKTATEDDRNHNGAV